MARYMVLYNSDATARELMANSTQEEMKASMAEWMAWKEEADKTITFEWGLPLQPVGRITKDGNSESPNQASGHAYIDADSKVTVLALLANHPHLKRDGATIDVLELIPMPGM